MAAGDYISKSQWLVIPREVGLRKIEDASYTAQAVRSGAAVGTLLGAVVPGLGNAAGATIGATLGWLSGVFGGGKDEVRDVMRQILAAGFGQAMPGRVQFVGSAKDVPRLIGQFSPLDIRRAVNEIGAGVTAALPDGPNRRNLEDAFSSYTIGNEPGPGSAWWQLVFDPIPNSTPSQANVVQSNNGGLSGSAGIVSLGVLALGLFGRS